MSGQTIILRPQTRTIAASVIANAPDGHVVNVAEPKRTTDQNAKMWAMLSDVCRACPEGRKWDTATWKAAFMAHLGHEIRWVQGLDNDPLPVGFKTSRLNKSQMADLITCIYEYGDRHGVVWSERIPGAEA